MKIKELTKELKLIEKELNHIYDDEGLVVDIRLIEFNIIPEFLNYLYEDQVEVKLELKDIENNEVIIDSDCLYDESMSIDNLLYELIRSIYEDDINPNTSYIKATKGFNARKIKSLSLWKSRNKFDKVNEIMDELIDRHNKVEKAKSQLLDPKELIKYLYQIKSRYAESEVI